MKSSPIYDRGITWIKRRMIREARSYVDGQIESVLARADVSWKRHRVSRFEAESEGMGSVRPSGQF